MCIKRSKIRKTAKSPTFAQNQLIVTFNFVLETFEQDGTSTVGAISKVQKSQRFLDMFRKFLNVKVSVLKRRKGAFRARKTLQKFRYNVLKHIPDLSSNPSPPPQ